MRRIAAIVSMVMLAGLILSGCKLEDLFGDELTKLARSEAVKAQSELRAQLLKQDEKQRSLEGQFSTLQEKLGKTMEALEAHKASMESRYDGTHTRISNINKQAALISGEDPGFAIARTEFGPVIVNPKGLTPYLDGYKLKLWIGNVTASTLADAKLKVQWGIPFRDLADPAKKITPEEFITSNREREVSLPGEFPSGRYTEVEVTLTPAQPRDVKEIFVSVSFGGMSLLVPLAKK